MKSFASFCILPIGLALVLAATAPAPAAPPAGTQPPAEAAPQPASQPASAAPYRVVPATQPAKAVIGSTDPRSGFALAANLTYYGAGLYRVALTDHKEKALSRDPYVILNQLSADGGTLYPLAARSIVIDGQPVELGAEKWNLVQSGPDSATYTISIETEDGHPVLDIARTISLDKGSYDIRCLQRFINRSGAPLKDVVWQQYLQGDIVEDGAAYMGDRRMFEAGYHNLSYNSSRQFIYVDEASILRGSVLKTWDTDKKGFWPPPKVPRPNDLVWLAASNRYFTLVVHPPVPAQGPVPALVANDPQIGLAVYGTKPASGADTRVMLLTYSSEPFSLAAGGMRELELDLFAGPRDPKLFAQPPYSTLALDKTIVYNLGGPCAFCTFQWLAQGLLYLLKGVYFVARDWGVAIIFLVLFVRLVLHPLTRRSQIAMTKMSKQMATLQPELEKLKKKFKDDPKGLQAAQMQLYREKNINPMGMVGGCLPMLLQMPIWAALYAMLYYAIELRHQPAFYGLFQAVSGGRWTFLADLSSPDNFIKFGGNGVTLDLYFIHPNFAGINVIPILMGLVFFLQQKLTAPPAANPDAARQQKMMAVMTTFLFPVMMYSSPSGLTLYIMASTAAGIVDSYVVRRHIKREEEAGTLFAAKPAKASGFWARMQDMAAEKQRRLTGDQPRRYKDRN